MDNPTRNGEGLRFSPYLDPSVDIRFLGIKACVLFVDVGIIIRPVVLRIHLRNWYQKRGFQ